jgi:hypothetical protein
VSRVGDVPYRVGAILVEADGADQDAPVRGERQRRHPSRVTRVPGGVIPGPEADEHAEHQDDRGNERGRYQGAAAKASHRKPFQSVRRVEVCAHCAGSEVEHDPRARAVLIEHVEEFVGIPLPPAARVAADQATG